MYEFVFSFACILFFPFQKAMPLGSKIILAQEIIFFLFFPLAIYVEYSHIDSDH